MRGAQKHLKKRYLPLFADTPQVSPALSNRCAQFLTFNANIKSLDPAAEPKVVVSLCPEYVELLSRRPPTSEETTIVQVVGENSKLVWCSMCKSLMGSKKIVWALSGRHINQSHNYFFFHPFSPHHGFLFIKLHSLARCLPPTGSFVEVAKCWEL